MKIFITGGTGFIGSYIVKELSKNGHYVSLLARNPKKVPALEKLPGVEIIAGDITDFSTIKKMLAGKNACIHVALHWGNTATEMLRNDTFSSVKIFEMAAESGVKEIIYTSSTAVNDWVYMNEASRAGGEKNTVFENTKQRPVTYYGATKAATEVYLNAIAFNYKIKSNIVRPGYTFGNPVVNGSDIQSDKRLNNIVDKVRKGENIEVIKNDGTQFIWAGDLAKIYNEILESNVNGNMYFGLGNRFLTWEHVANEAVSLINSKSKVIIKDLGWPEKPALFDVEGIRRDFGLSFDSSHHIKEHIRYLAFGD